MSDSNQENGGSIAQPEVPVATPDESRPKSVVEQDRLNALRTGIGCVIFVAFPLLLILTICAAIFLGVVIGNQSFGKTIERMGLAASIQVGFGMVMGFVALFVGVMMTWFGISADFALSGKLATAPLKGAISLKSASPGLAFAIGGLVLIGVCLYKPIVYEEKGGIPMFNLDVEKKVPFPETPPKVD